MSEQKEAKEVKDVKGVTEVLEISRTDNLVWIFKIFLSEILAETTTRVY